MKKSQHSLLLIYFKRKEGEPLTAEEQHVWEEYKEHTRGELLFDEEALARFARYQQQMSSWEEFKAKHNISFPIAFTGQEQKDRGRVRRLQRTSHYLAIAVALILVIGDAWLSLHNPANNKAVASSAATITPGDAWSTLVLADGRTIVLDSTAQGPLAQQGNTTVYSPSSGLLQYQHNAGQAGQTPGWNYLHIPRGKEHRLQLTDGTQIWLNAATVLRYPADFGKGAREVVLEEGEAYFEVAKSAQPFIVRAKEQKIEVLGTQFNLRAYKEDSSIITTLVEGSIGLSYHHQQLSLMPGRQTVLNHEGQLTQSQANLWAVTAWKHDYFAFDNTRLSEIMTVIARWYNVEVVYTEPVNDERFMISRFSRNEPLSLLLIILEATGGIHYEIRGRTIYISK